jgi:predicted ABC-type ATPase
MNKAGPLCPRCIIIAGPNGAGKTTFAREFLAKEAGVVHFVNVPRRDVLRRFTRSGDNFEQHYRVLADAWSVYDNSARKPILLEQGP